VHLVSPTLFLEFCCCRSNSDHLTMRLDSSWRKFLPGVLSSDHSDALPLVVEDVVVVN